MFVLSASIIIISLVYFIRWYYINVYLFNKRLRRFKTPPAHPIFGHTLDLASPDSLSILCKYTEQYGENVRIIIGPLHQLIFTSDPKLLEFVLTSPKILDKSIHYRRLENWLGTGLLTGAGLKWKKNRRIITPTFHYKILENFTKIIETNSTTLVEELDKCSDQNNLNIAPFIKYCTLDIIVETSMGTKINAQTTGKSSKYVKATEEMCRITVERAFNIKKALDLTYYFTEDYKKEQEMLKILHTFSQNVIEARKKNRNLEGEKPKGEKAFLDLLLDSPELTLNEIQEEVETFMFAGHDTTGTAISFALYNIANNSDVQEKLLYEQQYILNNDFSRPLKLEDLKQMKYLEIVIKESLRLYPSVPYFAREVTEEIIYDGEVLPKGLIITCFIFGLHRNKKYFPNPEQFDPSRFERTDSSQAFTYLPFSAGYRNCIGQKFAMIVMKIVISKVIQTFKLLPTDPKTELDVVAETVLKSRNGVRINLKKRDIS